MADLTPREKDVIFHVLMGKSDYRIAEDMGISQHTVRFHLSSIAEKLPGDAPRPRQRIIAWHFNSAA